VRLAGELIGRHAFALFASAGAQGIEFARQNVAGPDQGASPVLASGRRPILLRQRGRHPQCRHHNRTQSEVSAESSFRHFNRFRVFG
jgi:hypothetical protein